MHLIAIDRFESTFSEIRLGGRGEEVKLAETPRGQPVQKLPDDPPPETLAPVLGVDRDGANERRELISLRSATACEPLAVMCD